MLLMMNAVIGQYSGASQQNDYYAGYNNNQYQSDYYNNNQNQQGYNNNQGYQNAYSSGYSNTNGYSNTYGGAQTGIGTPYSNSYSGSTNTYQAAQPYTGSSNLQGSQTNFYPQQSAYNGDTQQCDGKSTDFILRIPAGGCTPNVVRSDLLAEQNVPIFCKISALQLNPLIDVSSIRSISFAGDTPEGVSGISYHPARQAIRNYNTLLSSPAIDDAGYIVITLNRQADEREINEWVEGNVTARISYDARNVFGIGNAEFYVEAGEPRVPFWNGLGYLAVQEVQNGFARVEVYAQQGTAPYQTFNLQEGQTSPQIYFPGYHCSASMSVRLNRVVEPSDMALLNVEGEEIWVREGSQFLQNRCRVRSININAGEGGTVDVNCGGRSQRLSLKGTGITLSTESGSGKYVVGDKVSTPNGDKYLTHYGEDSSGKNFVIYTDKELSSADQAYISSLYSTSTTNLEDELKGLIQNDNRGQNIAGNQGNGYYFNYIGEQDGGIRFDSQNIAQFDNDQYLVQYEMDQAETAVRDLTTFYAGEEKFEGAPWGEEALYEQILLSQKAGFKQKQNELLTLFKETYPSSRFLSQVLKIETQNQRFDYSEAQTTIRVNNEYFSIVLDSLRAQEDSDESATIKFNGRSTEFIKQGQQLDFTDGKLTVEDIRVNGVLFKYQPIEGNAQSRFIGLGSFGTIGGRELEVRDIDTKQVAYLSVVPNIRKSFSEADFGFKIGVEKRNIELNPQVARDVADQLNKTIAEWEEILDTLGNVIKVWKATCFATSTILMLQSMLSGFSGESLARAQVMKEYKTICDIEIAKGTYQTRTQCYNEVSGNIDGDVARTQNAINNVNQKLKETQQGNVNDGGFLENPIVANQTQYVEDLKNNLNWQGQEIDGVKVETKDLTKSTQVSKVMLYQELNCQVTEQTCLTDPSSDVSCCSALKDMNAALKSAAVQKKSTQEGERASQTIQNAVGGNTQPIVQSINARGINTKIWSGQRKGSDQVNLPKEIPDESKIQFIVDRGFTYVLQLRESTLGGTMGVENAYKQTGSTWEKVTDLSESGLNKLVFMGGSTNACSNNPIKNPQVRYYESGRNARLPAIVPFDVANGWYAYVPSSIGSQLTGTPTSYTEAADVNFFWICNAGKNGVIEQKTGDDLCQSFSSNQVGFNSFIACGLEGNQVTSLYARARDSIRQAAQSYGRTGFQNVNGETISTGEPLSDTGSTECQDFMSPEDCKLLFNTCDPVICPSSRCDMGGKYPVADVVQTGIVGSIALCLPNAKEGIIFPVCLTGVHAGIDAFVSILKSQQQCLEHNIETGQYVGICDEITAIYMCELFWRNFGSVLDVLLPTFFEQSFGGPTTRGGGEYQNVQFAWDNLGKSMDFFTGFYAENAIQSFQLRGSQQVGTQVCNGFLGTTLPTSLSAEGFDALLSPESPTQFYAYFSEIPFSSATVPATSQYKVYYHIYAGNDFGASYQVYLRSPTQSGSFATSPTASVKTGFVARGQSADEAIDFTSAGGYKELCVRINGQENCGFGTVSTNFAVNFATEKYAQDQATQTDITSESECLSTTSSAWGLVSPNLQAGVETAVGGEDINLVGITRVCANANPSAGTGTNTNTATCRNNNECGQGSICQRNSGSEIGNCVDQNGNGQQGQGRWVDVGYCDNPELRCWLDSATIQDRFNAIDAVNSEFFGQTSTVEDQIRYGQMFEGLQENYQLARATLSTQYERIKALSPSQLRAGDSNPEISAIISDLNAVLGVEQGAGQGTANNKAEALALKATVYRMIVEQKIKDQPSQTIQGNNFIEPTQQIPEQTGEIIPVTSPDEFVGTPPTPVTISLTQNGDRRYIGNSKYYIQGSSILRENAAAPDGISAIIGNIADSTLSFNPGFGNEQIGQYSAAQLNGATVQGNAITLVN